MKNFVSVIIILLCLASFSNLVNAAQKPTIYCWDLRWLQTTSDPNYRYDMRHMAACVQGLVNRDAPRVFLEFTSDDVKWLERLQEPGGLCEGWNIHTINDITDYISHFRSDVNGVVLYDPDPATGVISTMLVATTVAGVEDGIAVRKLDKAGSVYRYLVVNARGAKLPVIKDLTGMFTGTGTIPETTTASTGSAKCDAYIWAKEKYIDTGLCDSTKLMYNLDLWGCRFTKVDPNKTSLPNLDYAVSKKAFCLELSPWGDEKPNDDPTQVTGTDLNTFKAILNACNVQNNYSEMIKMCGYISWDQKYTSRVGGKHGDVATEQELTKVLTSYNTYLEAESVPQNYISNASFYNALMPAIKNRRYIQNPAPTKSDLIAKNYINSAGTSVVAKHYAMLYLGDYEGATWLSWELANQNMYEQSHHGEFNCCWAITPQLIERGSVAIDYMYRHKTAKDFFISANAGAGYINPCQLYNNRPTGYGSAVTTWQEHCRKYYRMMDISITGWLMNGTSGGLPGTTEAQNVFPFSGDGVGLDNYPDDQTPSQWVTSNIPVMQRTQPDDPSGYELNWVYSSGVRFDWWRTCFKTPDNVYNDVVSVLDSDQELVDPYTFFYLYRFWQGGNNNYRATWAGDSIPRIMQKDKAYFVTVTVRNDGWDTWSESAGYRLAYAIVPRGTEPQNADYDDNGRFKISGSSTVAPGASYVFDVNIVAPDTTGDYDIYYDMVKDGTTWFKAANNIEWKSELIVADKETDIDTDGDGTPDVIEERAGTLYWHPDDSVQCGDLGYLTADISGTTAGVHDCYVNIYDLAELMSQWLQQGAGLTGDFTGDAGVPDESVDFYDFCIMASTWIECTDPTNSNCWQ